MTRKRQRPSLKRKHRLLFFYFFRDFDNRTLDAGFEFTTLASVAEDRVLCRSISANVKGLRRDSFLVDWNTRHILNLPGHYIVYWTSGKRGLEQIYSRTYQTQDGRIYTHNSSNVQSKLSYDEEGLEKRAENFVFRPRRYHEKFIRLLRF